MIAAQTRLVPFGAAAIDGTKIAANASTDANGGLEGFARHAADIVAEAEGTNASEGVAPTGGSEHDGANRLGSQLGDRIRAAALEVAAAQQRHARADDEHEARSHRDQLAIAIHVG